MPFRLYAAPFAAVLLTVVTILPGHAAEFTDSAGRRVILPDRVARVLTAGPSADVLIFSLAPNDLVGWSRPPTPPFLPPNATGLPVTGMQLGPDLGADAAIVRRTRPDIVVAAGPVTPAEATLANRLQQATGIPCVLVDDSIQRMPTMLRSLGAVLGVSTRAENLGAYAEHVIDAVRGRLLIQPTETRPRVYYGRRDDGLETALPGSPAAATIENAGVVNVAGSLGRDRRVIVTPQQILAWAPTVIIAEKRAFYDALLHDPAWSQVPAVQQRQVFLAPSSPFGWIDDPPGVNRLLGLFWLSTVLYPDQTQESVRDSASEFYGMFYQEKLTDAQLTALVNGAEAPRKPGQKNPTEALLGIGTAPTTGPIPQLPPAPAPTGPYESIPGGMLKY